MADCLTRVQAVIGIIQVLIWLVSVCAGVVKETLIVLVITCEEILQSTLNGLALLLNARQAPAGTNDPHPTFRHSTRVAEAVVIDRSHSLEVEHSVGDSTVLRDSQRSDSVSGPWHWQESQDISRMSRSPDARFDTGSAEYAGISVTAHTGPTTDMATFSNARDALLEQLENQADTPTPAVVVLTQQYGYSLETVAAASAVLGLAVDEIGGLHNNWEAPSQVMHEPFPEP